MAKEMVKPIELKGPKSKTRRPLLTSPVLIVMGVLAATFYYRDPNTNVAQAAVYLTMAWAAPLSILLGLRRHRPVMRQGWVLIGRASALWAIGETIWYFEALVLGIPEPFGWPDLFYLSSVATLIWGIRTLVRAKNPRSSLEGAFDGVVLATAGAAVLWYFSLGQQIGPTGSSMPVRVLVVLYPLADLILLSFAARLAFLGYDGNRSSVMLTMSIVSLLTADLGFAIILQHVGSEPPWVDAGWIMFFAFLGAAALHPSMARVAEKSRATGPPGIVHVILISFAALVGPFLGLYRAIGDRRGLGVGLEIFTIVIVGAVLVQVTLIARDRARHVEHNRTATARLEAERALRESEERLRTVARQVAIVLLACEADGTCTVSEGLALAHLGLRPGELVGKPLSSAPPSCRPMVSVLEEMLTGSQDVTSVDVVLEGRTFQLTASAVGPDGGPRGLLALATDVTERVLQEKSVQRSALRQRASAEISAAIVETTFESERLIAAVLEKISDVLGATCVMASFGTEGEMAIKASPQASTTLVDAIREFLLGDSAITGPSMLTPNGVRAFDEAEGCWSVAFPIHSEGESFGIFVASREKAQPPFDAQDYAFLLNVTERTTLALENCHLFGDLRHELGERRRSEELLRESEQRWRAFGTEASHQLRTPLTGLRLRIDNELADSTRNGPPTPTQWRQILAETLQHLDNLESTVHDFLALVPSRHASVEPLDVAVLLDEIGASWGSLIEASGRQFVLNAESRLPLALISGAAVRQVLGVLLDNALRHGAGRITLVAKELAGSVALEVHDEGVGFVNKGDPSEPGPDGRQGHNIGLSLARSLAEAGGARLQLSNPGPCPSVSLFLPGCATDIGAATGYR